MAEAPAVTVSDDRLDQSIVRDLNLMVSEATPRFRIAKFDNDLFSFCH
jgi:hypothetical protein